MKSRARTPAGTCAFAAIAVMLASPAVLAGDAGHLDSRVWDAENYFEKGELGFVIDAKDDSGPGEGREKAQWSLTWNGKPVEAVATPATFRSAGPTSVLFVLAATENFVGAEEADASKDRQQLPMSFVMDGLASLKTSLGQQDFVTIACYDEVKGDPTVLVPTTAAAKLSLPAPDKVREKCHPAAGEIAQPRMKTVLMAAVQGWLAKKKDVQRFVVVIVTDGLSKEPVDENWWRPLQNQVGDKGWLEIYVIGLEDGGDTGKIQALGKGGVVGTATVRQNLPEEIGKLAPLVAGTGLYKVGFLVKDSVKGPGVELAVLAKDSHGLYRSDPVQMGELKRKSSWVRIVVLVLAILVGLALLVVVIAFIKKSMDERRRRREEEDAARANQKYDGPSKGKLIVREGPAAGNTFLLTKDVCYIGRSAENEVVLPDTSVGKRHASIRIHEKTYQLEDLQSVNGVFVNGQKTLKAHLKDGDSIRMGSTEMQFKVS